jgi:hypothetical protein
MTKIKVNKPAFAVCIIAALCLSMLGAAMPASATLPSTTTLTLTAGTYTQTKNAAEILAMPTVTGIGGTCKSGSTSNVGTYTGVSVAYLCNLVGTANSGSTIHVVATDGFTQDYTYAQVFENGLTCYDTSGHLITNQDTTLIVAYSYNGDDLPSGGPLRIMLVSDSGVTMGAKESAKYVASITIINPMFVAPEYPMGSLMALMACFAAVAAFLALKTGIGSPHFSKAVRKI